MKEKRSNVGSKVGLQILKSVSMEHRCILLAKVDCTINSWPILFFSIILPPEKHSWHISYVHQQWTVDVSQHTDALKAQEKIKSVGDVATAQPNLQGIRVLSHACSSYLVSGLNVVVVVALDPTRPGRATIQKFAHPSGNGCHVMSCHPNSQPGGDRGTTEGGEGPTGQRSNLYSTE